MTDERQTPQDRLSAANEAFAAAMRMLPPGVQGFQVPPWTEPTAATNALVRLLIDKGLISEQEFVDAKTTAIAELVEAMTEQARGIALQATGLVIAGPGQPV